MIEFVDFNVLSRKEAKNIFIKEIYKATKEEKEIFKLLSVFTAYNMSKDRAVKNFKYMTKDEITDTLLESLLEKDSTKEIEAWNIIIDTLGESKIFHIIDNVRDYLYVYSEINQRIDRVKLKALEIFTRKRKSNFC